MDVSSFVDWCIINEIAKNNDACFFSSCYMHYTPGEKLIMGPIWDFDIAFGNVNYNGNDEIEGLWILKTVPWYTRLLKDPAFKALVKGRFDYFYENMDVILSRINDDATYLDVSAVENNYKWSTLYKYTWPNSTVLGRYENEVSRLKSWTIARMNWLKSYFDGVQ